jgi:gamma-glutamyltranspeptidase / glutathione hydrolase
MNTLIFPCQKQAATGSRGMVVTNHPLASAAGAEMLLMGGNAFDAAAAALFALTVTEPMMVGLLGGGLIHIRTADGRHRIIDGLSTAPGAATPDMFRPLGPGLLPNDRETDGRRNALGGAAVAVPGALPAWVMMLENHGTLPLAEVMQPAIRLAARGFTVSPYLADCISDCSADIGADAGLAALFLPGGAPLQAGSRLVQDAYAGTLNTISAAGSAALRSGPLAEAVVRGVAARGGILTMADLASCTPLIRKPITGSYRGHEIIGPPPPASSGVHITQMLNIIEGFDVRAMGYGTADSAHLLAEALKIAFADRAATADPAFVDVPVEHLTSKSYGGERRAALSMERAQSWMTSATSMRREAGGRESPDTTHLTVADAAGNVVAATQTINGLFGACVTIPGTGMLANNYMLNFDPHPGRALSIAPGKRCFTSMAPMMVAKDGRVRHALGLPGGLRIFPSAFQAIVNLIDHRMTAQQAVEAPRLWTEGGRLELEPGYPEDVALALRARGHDVIRNPRIGGGMNAISFGDDGVMTGAACWRADGTPVAIAGGLARAGVRFSI